ncbi:MAG: transaldolase [Patescibacteria group bacterium]|jgi:transaldolase
MKYFLDSADIEEIKQVKKWGFLDGVTTNPSLIKKAAEKNKIKDLEKYIIKLLKICKDIPVSLEVIGSSYKEMIEEGKILQKKFGKIANNLYVKVPINPCLKDICSNNSDGIKTISQLSKLRIKINTTLIFTPEQALLAARAGAKFVSPFVGREDDYIRKMNQIKFDKKDYFPKDGYLKRKQKLQDSGIVSGVDLIRKTAESFKKNKIKAKILAASIRSKRQLREVELAGAHIATIPFSVIESLMAHPKTVEGMIQFKKDTIPEYAKIFTKRKNKK